MSHYTLSFITFRSKVASSASTSGLARSKFSSPRPGPKLHEVGKGGCPCSQWLCDKTMYGCLRETIEEKQQHSGLCIQWGIAVASGIDGEWMGMVWVDKHFLELHRCFGMAPFSCAAICVQEKDCQLATELDIAKTHRGKDNPWCPDGLPKLCCVNVMPTSCMSYKNILSLPDANPCVSAFCCVAPFWFRHCMPWAFIYSFIMAPTFNPRVPNKGKLWQVLKRPASAKNKYPNAASFVRADRHK